MVSEFLRKGDKSQFIKDCLRFVFPLRLRQVERIEVSKHKGNALGVGF